MALPLYSVSASAGTDTMGSATYICPDINQTTATANYSSYWIDNSANNDYTSLTLNPQQQEYGSQIFYGSVDNFQVDPELEEKLKKDRLKLEKAQAKAEELKGLLMPKEQLLQLEMQNRVEIVARNGSIYEILKNGKVNKLLPDGLKQGLCIYPQHGPYPVADEILAKKALLEADPERFEEIANKVAAFPLAS